MEYYKLLYQHYISTKILRQHPHNDTLCNHRKIDSMQSLLHQGNYQLRVLSKPIKFLLFHLHFHHQSIYYQVFFDFHCINLIGNLSKNFLRHLPNIEFHISMLLKYLPIYFIFYFQHLLKDIYNILLVNNKLIIYFLTFI